MDLFEWQAKELFGKYGVPTTKQVVVSTPSRRPARPRSRSAAGR